MHPLVSKQKAYFLTGETKSLKMRINTLKKLKQVIKTNETAILNALYQDLGKSNYEAYITEVGFIYQEIDHMIKRLPKLSKVKKVKTPLTAFPAKSFIMREPYGVVLIISPWNYPFQLTLAPLIGAIAAGNTAIIKPSRFSYYTSNIIKKLIEENFPEEYLAVVLGGKVETEELIDSKVDYVFFTGSVAVGKQIASRCGNLLIPYTLELGGKSPCIIDKSADLDLAAKRVVFGKLMNAGQTCVAPDYLLVHESVKDNFILKLKTYIDKFYPHPLSNDSYPKIITKHHFERLIKLFYDEKVLFGGKFDADNQKIEPTIIELDSLEHPVMQEEIFGPIFPIIVFKDITEVITTIRSFSHPLALYLFTNDKEIEKLILNNITFGGGCVNDTLLHLATPYLPFGGVGDSGIGNYHGDYSFKTFSREKSVLKKGKVFDLQLRYPPYDDKKLKLIKKIIK